MPGSSRTIGGGWEKRGFCGSKNNSRTRRRRSAVPRRFPLARAPLKPAIVVELRRRASLVAAAPSVWQAD